MRLLGKLRKRGEAELEEPDPVVLPSGDSREIYGIVFTNAMGEPIQFKAYDNRVVVLCKPIREEKEDGEEEVEQEEVDSAGY